MEITEIGLLAVKKEVTYGTDPVPTAASNALPVVRDQLTYTVASTAIDRKLLDGTLDMVVGFNAQPNVTLKFRYELRGNRIDGANNLDITNGATTQAIEIDALLQAANLNPTYTAAVTPGVQGVSAGSRDGFVVYQPSIYSTQGPSVTCYFWTALKLHKLIGGKVNIDKITWAAGNIVFVDFSVTGKYSAVADATFPTTAAFIATKPPLFDNSTTTVGAYAAVFSQLTVELGNTISMRKSGVDVDSIAGFVIASMLPKGTIDPESVAEGTNPFWADWKSSQTRTITTTTGTATGNKFTGAFIGEYKTVTYGNRDNLRIHQAQFNIVKADLTGATGSQFQLKFF
jgi:hypothetical protein